jgi:hypothetical protein
MSFNHFSKFVKEHGQGQQSEITFDWSGVEQEKKPWIVIDFNNFVFAILDNLKGGHVALIEDRVELIWKSLVACGARVCIINDGKTHSDERAVKKLQRMHADILESTKGKTSFLTSELVPSLIYSVAKRVLNEQYSELVVNNIDDDTLETTYIFCTANGEADPVIRAFCQKKILLGNDVYVFSGDNCMLPGISPTSTTHLYSVDLKSLSVVNSARKGLTVLKGTVYNVLTMLHHLGAKTNEVLGITGGPVTGEMFAYVCALLYSETAVFRHYEYDQPTPLVTYVKAYLCGERKYDDNYFVMSLYVTSALVRAWFKSSSRTSDDIAHCVAAIRDHAMAVNNRKRSQVINLFSLPCFFDNSAALLKYARKLLFVSEQVSDSQKVYCGHKLVGRSALSNTRLCVHVDYASKGVLYSATPTGGGYVTYSPVNDVRDGCPVRLGSEQVAHDISKEIMHRRNALAGLGPPLLNNRRTLWGNWSDNENLDLNTEQLMSPLLSLVKQIEFMRNRVPLQRQGQGKGEGGHGVGVGLGPPSVNSVRDPGSFNSYLLSIVERSRTKSKNLTDEGRELGDGDYGDYEEDKNEVEGVDPQGTISLITSIIRLDAASLRRPDIYTCTDLYNRYARTHKHLPSSGVIVAAVGDEVGMMFKTPQSEPVKCSNDVRYVNSAYGTLFCLRNRANYLQQLVYPPPSAAAAAASTRGEEKVQDKGQVEELTQKEKAASAIFRSLDITKAAGDAACSAISACWLALTCGTHEQRTRLVTEVTLHRTASHSCCTPIYYTVVFSVLYCTALYCTAMYCTAPHYTVHCAQ